MRRPLVGTWPVRALAALALWVAVAAGCRREPESAPPPEVALHATVSEGAVQALASAAAQRRVARVRRVASVAEADVLWLADPTEVVAASDVIARGGVPELPEVDERFKDPRRRFAPLCARATVLLVAPRAAVPFEVRNLRDLADPRLAGRVAVPPLAGGGMPAALAALSATYGSESLERFLALLSRNQPQVAGSEAEVRGRVARGEAAVGLAGSEEGAAGAVSAAALDVVIPDQAGRGAVVLPTAVALAARAADAPAARALVEFLTGSDAERLLAARVPGFMPLRPDVPVPVGVRPAGNVAALRLDWDRVAAEKGRLADRLRRWPAP